MQPNYAVVFLLCRDCGCDLGLYGRALTTGEATSQLGPQLLDVVVKRDHRPLFLFRRRRSIMGDLRRENGSGVMGARKPRPDCSGRGDVAGAISRRWTCGRATRSG